MFNTKANGDISLRRAFKIKSAVYFIDFACAGSEVNRSRQDICCLCCSSKELLVEPEIKQGMAIEGDIDEVNSRGWTPWIYCRMLDNQGFPASPFFIFPPR
jgi:hypothetical protein